ncbi:MAG: alpha/beta hydrolase family protein [Promethearchaeota archaeon]
MDENEFKINLWKEELNKIKQSGIKVKEFKIEKADGKTLNAKLYKANEPSSSLIILCHGFTGDQDEWGRFIRAARIFAKEGFDALTFDFTGSGKNPREPVCLSKQVKDLEEVCNWAISQGYESIGTLGLSFGGLTSLVANIPQRKAAVFWAPGFYLKKAMKLKEKMLAYLGLKLMPNKIIKQESLNNEPILITSQFIKEIFETDTNEYLKKFTTPALLVQGTKDDRVKAELNFKAIEYFPKDEHHKLIKVEGADHDFYGEHLDQFIKVSLDWFKKYMK